MLLRRQITEKFFCTDADKATCWLNQFSPNTYGSFAKMNKPWRSHSAKIVVMGRGDVKNTDHISIQLTSFFPFRELKAAGA
jgi:hypothetical protein